MILIKLCPIWHGVEQRPEGLIAAAVVEVVEESRLDADGHGLLRLEPCCRGDVIRRGFRDGVHLLVEGVEPGPADPRALAVDDDGGDGSHEAAGAGSCMNRGEVNREEWIIQ